MTVFRYIKLLVLSQTVKYVLWTYYSDIFERRCIQFTNSFNLTYHQRIIFYQVT
jgi:hypothetical protein